MDRTIGPQVPPMGHQLSQITREWHAASTALEEERDCALAAASRVPVLEKERDDALVVASRVPALEKERDDARAATAFAELQARADLAETKASAATAMNDELRKRRRVEQELEAANKRHRELEIRFEKLTGKCQAQEHNLNKLNKSLQMFMPGASDG